MDAANTDGISIDNIISIINIFVTAGVGIWIAISVNKKLSSDRALKDYFIQEIKENKKFYAEFFNKLYQGKLSAKDIKDWLKIMSNRIACIEESLNSCFKIKKEDFILKEVHSKIQNEITSFDDFNDQFREKYVIFDDSSKRIILDYHVKIIDAFTRMAVTVNKSVRKKALLGRKKK